MNYSFDVLILGGGAAGLMSALQLEPSLRIAVLSKNDLADGSTAQAQGGVSAVLDDDDSFDSHVRDTINAGAGLCQQEVVEHTVAHGPEAIAALDVLGVQFTQEGGGYHLTREGGHSHRRVAHVADATGKAISTALIQQVKQRDNIQIFSYHIAIDLVTDKKLGGTEDKVHGAYVLDEKADKVVVFQAKTVILATGGASKVYLYTSNPDGSTGDGIAMAWRAGCKVANMEFNQFHPTCLFHPHAKSFLVSEAVRGEGGKLYLPDGTRFMQEVDTRAELAPRDVVAREIDHQMKKLGIDNVYLDISFKSPEFIAEHFPRISKRVQKYGMDMSQEWLPVVPAAHYTCGGVVTDLAARTSLAGLYAVGEAAHTGLHGANRMASNSLLECLVFAKFAAKDINQNIQDFPPAAAIPAWDESRVYNSDEKVVVSHNWEELRRFMWDYVGIVRTNKRLARAKRRAELLQEEIDEYYGNFRVHGNLLELRNLVQAAKIMIDSALQREESRGLHYNLDYPERLPEANDTVLQRKQ